MPGVLEKLHVALHYGIKTLTASPFFSCFYYSSVSVLDCLSIDSLPNRQYDLDWTLMGGDFRFDPRLKRHRVFTVAPTVLCTLCLKARKTFPRLHLTKRNVLNTLLYHSANHLARVITLELNSWHFIYWNELSEQGTSSCSPCPSYRPVRRRLNCEWRLLIWRFRVESQCELLCELFKHACGCAKPVNLTVLSYL